MSRKISWKTRNCKPDDFDEVVEEKAKLTDQLDQLDSGFETSFRTDEGGT